MMEEKTHEARKKAHTFQTKQGFDHSQTLVVEPLFFKTRLAFRRLIFYQTACEWIQPRFRRGRGLPW